MNWRQLIPIGPLTWIFFLAASTSHVPLATGPLATAGESHARGRVFTKFAAQQARRPAADHSALLGQPPVAFPIAGIKQAHEIGRLRGEFDQQHALLLGCEALVEETPELFVEIVRQTRGRIPVVALVSDLETYEYSRMILSDVVSDHVRYAEVVHNSQWVRDYGPIVVTTADQQPVVVDASYVHGREADDRVPEELARLLNLPLVCVPLAIDGGNLLTNGDGLAIVTEEILVKNIGDEEHLEEAVNEDQVLDLLASTCGLQEIVVLEPLRGEPTGHVDMFATFVSPNTVLVGEYSADQDQENAAVLDRNAARLSGLRTSQGPLRVVRVPMPPRDDGRWRTYTNVIYINGAVLVPVYPSVDQEGRQRAFAAFSESLPGWEIIGVDASQIIKFDGALHCIAMNLGAIGKMPAFPRPKRRRLLAPDEQTESRLSRRVPRADVQSRRF